MQRDVGYAAPHLPDVVQPTTVQQHSRSFAMDGFRLPLPTAQLPLPRDMRDLIGLFLGQGRAGDLSLALVLIRHGARERMKRCTPCRRCHRTCTYTACCTACDRVLWMEM